MYKRVIIFCLIDFFFYYFNFILRFVIFYLISFIHTMLITGVDYRYIQVLYQMVVILSLFPFVP